MRDTKLEIKLSRHDNEKKHDDTTSGKNVNNFITHYLRLIVTAQQQPQPQQQNNNNCSWVETK